jgi:hypothetical protein
VETLLLEIVNYKPFLLSQIFPPSEKNYRINLRQGIVRIVAIMCSNHRAFTAYLLEEDDCHCHCQRGLLGAATIVEEELELAATIIDQRTNGAAPWMPINRGIRLRAK